MTKLGAQQQADRGFCQAWGTENEAGTSTPNHTSRSFPCSEEQLGGAQAKLGPRRCGQKNKSKAEPSGASSPGTSPSDTASSNNRDPEQRRIKMRAAQHMTRGESAKIRLFYIAFLHPVKHLQPSVRIEKRWQELHRMRKASTKTLKTCE